MKRLIELLGVLVIGGLAYYLWKTYGSHATEAATAGNHAAALQDQQTNWRLPWDQSPDSFINLSNDIGKALGYVSDGLPTLSSQTISVGNKQGN